MKDRYILINSLGGGGAEKVALALGRFLGIKALFLLERSLSYSIEEDRSIVFLSGHTNNMSSILKTLHIPLYVKRLERYVEDGDIVVSFLERANFTNILLSHTKKTKSVISVRVSLYQQRKRFHPYTLLCKFLYPKAHRIVSVSQFIKHELIHSFGISPHKIEVIYNPVSIEYIKDKAGEDLGKYKAIFSGADHILVTLGRLTEQKGHSFLIRVFGKVKRKMGSVKLLILGEGELLPHLIELSKSLGLRTYYENGSVSIEDADVYFLGFQKNPYKFIANSSLFVFPSLWEGFPNALLEALVCGLPVISADCYSGPREILAPSTDYTIQTSQPEYAEYGVLMPVFSKTKNRDTEKEVMWVDTICALLEDFSLMRQYSERSKIRAMDFESSKIFTQWEKTINQI